FVHDLQRERWHGLFRQPQNFPVGCQDEMVLEVAADLGIPPRRLDRILISDLRFELQVQVKRQGRRIARRAEIVGRGGQRDAESARLLPGSHRYCRPSFSNCSRVLATASTVASSTSGARCSGAREPASFSCGVPAKRSPRWNFKVNSGSFKTWPVKISTTLSFGLTNPCFTNFFNPAKVTAEAGSQPTPSAPISALAMAISISLTCSTAPPVVSTTRRAFFHDAGFPMRIAVASVSA